MSFLPGHFPGGGKMAAREKLQTMAFVDSVSASAHELTAMSDIRAGDLLIFMASGATYGGAQSTVPAGFTLLTTQYSPVGSSHNVSYKIASGNEDGTTLTGQANAGFNFCKLLHFRGNSEVRNVSAAQSVTFVETSSNPSDRTITSGSGVVPTIALGNAYTNGSMTGSSYFGLTVITGNNNQHCSYAVFNSSPQDVSFDTNDGGSDNALLGLYINVS